MLALDIQETTKNWQLLNNTLFVPHNESDYEYLVKLLDSLIMGSRKYCKCRDSLLSLRFFYA